MANGVPTEKDTGAENTILRKLTTPGVGKKDGKLAAGIV